MERVNPWWKGEPDTTFESWSKLSVKWHPKEESLLSLQSFSLNFLSGTRQVGKTTLVKLLINRMIERGVDARKIFYFSCDELVDHEELGETLDSYLLSKSAWKIKSSFIFLDEVTFVEDWWRALKSRIDSGLLVNDVVTVTGSASLDLLKQREHFPGRRGKGVDLILRPIGFRSYVKALKGIQPHSFHGESGLGEIDVTLKANRIYLEPLTSSFLGYLETGGFPLAIQEKTDTGRVTEYSRKALLDGLRGDFLRIGRSEKMMKEVLGYIISARGTPVSWLSISKDTSISSPNTSRVYIETLEDLLLLTTLELLTPDFKVMDRKNKKLHFSDPFIYQVMTGYTGMEIDAPSIVEATVTSHLSRKYDSYYWRNHSEADVIAVTGDDKKKTQHGFEVKWGTKRDIKPKHIKSYLSLNRETIPLFLASLPFA